MPVLGLERAIVEGAQVLGEVENSFSDHFWASTINPSKTRPFHSNKNSRGPIWVPALRILGVSWGVKTTCFEAPGVSLGGSGVSIGGVKIVRELYIYIP